MIMAASNTTTILPNPYTPMAFVPPEMETRIMGQAYAAVGSLAVLLWDIILHLPQDYQLVTQYRINFSFIVYSIARIASLAFVFGTVIIMTVPTGNCDSVHRVSLLYPFTIPLTTLLFDMRVSAVYGNSKYVVAFFSVAWLFVFCGGILVPISTSGARISVSEYCADKNTKLATSFAAFALLIHDSFVFLAISWALKDSSFDTDDDKINIRALILGKHLPAFSKSVLRDGQAYYLVTVIMGIVFLVFYNMPHTPTPPSTIGIISFVMLSNVTSYVYRNVRLGVYRDYTITTSVINKALQEPGQPAEPRWREIVFASPPSSRLEDRGDLESGGSVNQTSEIIEVNIRSSNSKGEMEG